MNQDKINIAIEFDLEISLKDNFVSMLNLMLINNILLNIKCIDMIHYKIYNFIYYSNCISIETKKKSNKWYIKNNKWKSCKTSNYTL